MSSRLYLILWRCFWIHIASVIDLRQGRYFMMEKVLLIPIIILQSVDKNRALLLHVVIIPQLAGNFNNSAIMKPIAFKKFAHLHPKWEGRIFPTQYRIFNAIDSHSRVVRFPSYIPQEGWHVIAYRCNTRKRSTFGTCGCFRQRAITYRGANRTSTWISTRLAQKDRITVRLTEVITILLLFAAPSTLTVLSLNRENTCDKNIHYHFRHQWSFMRGHKRECLSYCFTILGSFFCDLHQWRSFS
mmetsp:Transcript_46847/g.99465  ORF Transcript_46847/g.99465 Transcript_46847/m.99465 type:complete len:243 (+) Transcript_46847:2213-2941(+)